MVASVTNLGRNGLSDWVIQRFSAVVLAAYVFCLFGTFMATPEMDYAHWNAMFDSTWMRIFSLITLLSLCAHAWIGMWTITTDYLNETMVGDKSTFIRLIVQAGCALLTVSYLLWGIQIFWGI